ncbi:SdpI family protein [Yokenella regensburgei]|uniref:SdpI family protein n=1 Tax=Yokenella regensburgei TaxID=158877 RepID=UPI003F167C7C
MNFIWLGIVSLVLMAIAIPLVLQKVKPNRWYGVRTARTRNDEGQWYRVNRLYGKVMIVAGVAFFVFSALLGNWQPGEDNQKISLVLFMLEVLIPVFFTQVRARALGRK